MPTVHVLTHRTQISGQRLAGKVAIVVDVVFATTSIAIALERGAAEVVPALTPEAASEFARSLLPGSFVLAGELGNRPIPGFIEPWPHVLARQDLAGKSLVYSSTNGTVALRQSADAGLLLAAALVNGAAVAAYAAEHHAGRDIVLVCAGSDEAFNLEDFYGAGYLVSLLAAGDAPFHLTDAARAAWLLHERATLQECLDDARAGRMMQASGRGPDVGFCGQKSIFDVVPVCRGGRIARAGAAAAPTHGSGSDLSRPRARPTT